MSLFKRKTSKKLTASEKARVDRLKRQINPTTQNTIRYTSLYQEGLMHITRDLYSMSFKLGDVSYSTAQQEQRLDILDTHAKAINSIDSGSGLQQLIINRRLSSNILENIIYFPRHDPYEWCRQELNGLITHRFEVNANNFEIHKYLTISQEAVDRKQAQLQLQEAGETLRKQYKESDITLTDMTGIDRIKVFHELLNGNDSPTFTYEDIEHSGLRTKDFLAPAYICFREKDMVLNDGLAKVMYIKHYPKRMEDSLIRELTKLGIELAIAVNVRSYDTEEVLDEIEDTEAQAEINMLKSARRAGDNPAIPAYLAIGKKDQQTTETTEKWENTIRNDDQKVYSGIITVFFKGRDESELSLNTSKIKRATRKLGARFEEIFYHQEEALNTILPIGEIYLDLKRNIDIKDKFLRPMTTDNVATQSPFTNVDLISKSKNALYYGQNQQSKNIITLSRKRDLVTPSGMIIGSSGSGKGMTVKSTEIIPTRLKNPDDQIIIVDPEAEYAGIAEAFGGQVIDFKVGADTHINLLDRPNKDKLESVDNDFISHKASLLTSIFESILSEVSDEQVGLIDRVTESVYQVYEQPTLKEWHKLLKQQPEAEADNLALKLETYITGSNSIFAHQTNVDLSNKFIVFNLKNLKGKLKPFALLVLEDFIWRHIVENQGKITTWVYWDEIQLLFKSPEQASFFSDVWARFRKYGAIATGITQTPENMTETHEGRNVLANSEFFILLRMKKENAAAIRQVLSLTDEQLSYILKPNGPGSGLIVAGDVVVPFENPIPEDTKLYKLIHTSA
ncbi:VirB4-like conjugal transfer ATPase, CD1110 family [Streptococcus sp. S784/96/1]|uniref:VirB4-like conjugal transfer ATPase, CD1110 family n=1 Tax=Streptococcus sp. S784/96/1 TaxID=2653499 RepID=UPI0013874769|nr:DUF87 domain-containing protein [Streptococcus sp. S784/96/1]